MASTGNIANAFAHYMALAGISLAVFIPDDTLKANEAGVSCYGQKIFRVKGDYALARKICAEYSEKHGIFMSGGNIDPARVEAKKTQVFEWLRQLGYVPDVYVQALAGGTGPIAIDKALNDIRALNLVDKDPRYVMVQPTGCNPHAFQPLPMVIHKHFQLSPRWFIKPTGILSLSMRTSVPRWLD